MILIMYLSNLQPKSTNKPPPEQWQLPKFKPQAITGALTHCYGSLPDKASLEGSSWCDSVMVELAGFGGAKFGRAKSGGVAYPWNGWQPNGYYFWGVLKNLALAWSHFNRWKSLGIMLLRFTLTFSVMGKRHFFRPLHLQCSGTRGDRFTSVHSQVKPKKSPVMGWWHFKWSREQTLSSAQEQWPSYASRYRWRRPICRSAPIFLPSKKFYKHRWKRYQWTYWRFRDENIYSLARSSTISCAR